MRELTRHRGRLIEAAGRLARAELELRARRLLGRGVGRLLGAPVGRDAGGADLPGERASGEPPAGADPEELRAARRVGFAVGRAVARLPWEPTCLVQALACQRMLRRRGIAGRIELGVGRSDGLQAHAWVSVHGAIVVGAAEEGRYRPLASFERSS